MLTDKEIEIRRVVWTELSDFYLDTVLSDSDLKRKAEVFKTSGLTLDEIKNINYYEVGPQLIVNLKSNAGVWSGFNQEWLHATLKPLAGRERKRSRNVFKRVTDYFKKRKIDFYTSRYFYAIEDYFTNEKIL